MCGRGDPPVGAADPSGCSSTVFSTTTTATYVRLAIAVSMHSMRRGWFQLRGNAFALCLQQVHNIIGGRTRTKDNRVAMCWCAVSGVKVRLLNTCCVGPSGVLLQSTLALEYV
jgi:hypothetical protein